MLAVAYTFGMRRGELLQLRVRQVDLKNRAIRLEAGQTKNKKPRCAMMSEEVFQLLRECVHGKRREDFVFTRQNGGRIVDIRDGWATMCCRAGFGQRVCPQCVIKERGGVRYVEVTKKRCPNCHKSWKRDQLHYRGLIFHDLRRSAVRNLVRSGVSEKIAMMISGHRTRSVFDRYDIGNERDLREATRRLEAARKESTGPMIENGHTTGTPAEKPTYQRLAKVN
jgi:integrase